MVRAGLGSASLQPSEFGEGWSTFFDIPLGQPKKSLSAFLRNVDKSAEAEGTRGWGGEKKVIMRKGNRKRYVPPSPDAWKKEKALWEIRHMKMGGDDETDDQVISELMEMGTKNPKKMKKETETEIDGDEEDLSLIHI